MSGQNQLAELITEWRKTSRHCWHAWQQQGVSKSDQVTYQAESVILDRCADQLTALLAKRAS